MINDNYEGLTPIRPLLRWEEAEEEEGEGEGLGEGGWGSIMEVGLSCRDHMTI